MSELLCCPFCGGKAEMGVNKDSTVREYFVGCMNCHIRLYKIGYKRFYTEAEAVAAWNTRAERTCKVEGDYWHDHGGDGSDTYEFVLSCGHKVEWLDDDDSPRYCPRCGAKVVGE